MGYYGQDDAVFRESMRQLEEADRRGAITKHTHQEIHRRITKSIKRAGKHQMRAEIDGGTSPTSGAVHPAHPMHNSCAQEPKFEVQRRLVGAQNWESFATPPNEKQALKMVEKGNQGKVYEYRIRP